MVGRETYFDGTSYTALNSKSECVQKLGKIEDKIERDELVEVVRCGECNKRNKSADLTNTILCKWLHNLQMPKDGYCSYGERSVKK